MAQDGFQRLAQRVQTRRSREREPGVFDAPPQDFDQVQLRRIRGQILDEQSFLLPVREPVFKCLTRMDRRIVDDHHRLFRERLTKGITTGSHHTGVYGAFKHKWMQVVLAIHTPEHIDPPIFPGRQLDDALGLLPGRGNRGIKRTARCIKIVESDLPLILLGLQGGQCPLTAGKGLRITETLSDTVVKILGHMYPLRAWCNA